MAWPTPGGEAGCLGAAGDAAPYLSAAAQELLATLAAGPESESVTTFAPFVSPPLSAAAVGLSLALESGRVYTVEAASLSLVGATGTYDSANRWDLALESRTSAGAVPPAWGWRRGGDGGS